MKKNYRINCVFDVTYDDFTSYVGRPPKDEKELRQFASDVGNLAHESIDDNFDEIIGEAAENYEDNEDDDEIDNIEDEDEYK